jgi:hypothetical protein
MVGRPSLLRDEALQVLPVGKIDAAGKAPDAVENETAFDITTGAALGRKGRRRERIRIRAPDILLRLRVVHADDPVLHRQVGEDPSAGATAATELGGNLDHHADRHLVAAVTRGLKQPVESRVLKLLVRLVRDESVALCLQCAAPQSGDHGARSIQDFVTTGRLRNGSARQ